MSEIIQDSNILISKVISGNANQAEKELLEAWIAKSSENKSVFQKRQKVWKESAGWLSEENVLMDKGKVQQEVQKELSDRIQKIRRKSFIYKIAALIAIPVTFGITLYLAEHTKNIETKNEFCKITAPKGHISKCILPDGSEVWVNTGSTISYNTTTFNKKTREVQLSGEAYFEVAKNKKKPFKVNTPFADVNVTGTSFNVNAYNQSRTFETVLAEGSVELEIRNNANQKLKMTPGERVIYDVSKKKIDIEKVDTEMYSSWRKGEILFKDATLNDLITELERIYEISFHLKDSKLGEYRFRGMFSYNNNLIDALEKIKRTAGIDYYIQNKEVWLSKNRN